jgi:ABC-type Fe3+ transport system substrate-binding protein
MMNMSGCITAPLKEEEENSSLKKNKIFALIGLLLAALLCLAACGGPGGDPAPGGSGGSQTQYRLSRPGNKTVLTIVSGSENKELEPLLERFVEEQKIDLDMRYKGSLDIMRELGAPRVPYDAVWPASSLWISMGDTRHRVKHLESVSTTPVVFGIRQSLARQLGFVDRPVSVRDILDKIRSGELRFCMTSATQSNSGASAYIGFLYALLDNPDVITMQDLANPQLSRDITDLLAGVDRSSGSSEWLKTLFLEGDFDAMVNYESLILSTNAQLVKERREPLQIIYPYDGLSLSDSPLGYVDQGDKDKEEAFLKLQAFLMSPEIQKEIQQYGRRTGYSGIAQEYQSVFNPAWGADTQRVLSPIKMPERDVLTAALDLYQSQFRKPSLTVYCLDYSGSGGMCNERSSPSVQNCTFSGNTATGTFGGGGMYNYDDSSPAVVNCTFSGNTATSTGGGMHNGFNSGPMAVNCTFSGNTAQSGGGMFSVDGASPTAANTILWGNTARSDARGPDIFQSEGTLTLDHCVVGIYKLADGTSEPVTDSLITDDPQLIALNRAGSVTAVPAKAYIYALQAGSPALNAGLNVSTLVGGVPVPAADQRGTERPYGAGVDIGAFEGEVDTVTITYAGKGMVCDAGRGGRQERRQLDKRRVGPGGYNGNKRESRRRNPGGGGDLQPGRCRNGHLPFAEGHQGLRRLCRNRG